MSIVEAEQLARRLMDAHGLSQWAFKFDRAARRFGSCSYQRREITLSWKLTLLNDESQVRNTILHEIAHALAPGDGHGRKWKAACRRLGIDAKRCFTADEVAMPARSQSAYEIGCGTCDWWAPRHRRPTAMLVCKTCRAPALIRVRSSGETYRLVKRDRGIGFEKLASSAQSRQASTSPASP